MDECIVLVQNDLRQEGVRELLGDRGVAAALAALHRELEVLE